VLTLDPHAIVLGGGLSQLAHLYEKLPAAMSRHLFCGVRTCRYCRLPSAMPVVHAAPPCSPANN
jgi:hypothetical protein